MNYKKIAIFSLLLWVVTVSFILFKVIAGTVRQSDGRTEVIMTHSEKNFILLEMRQLLQSVHGIINGLEKNDFQLVEQSASAGGVKMMADLNPSLMMKLPLKFKQSGTEVHKMFDAIATAAARKDKQEIMGMLNSTMGSCVACHSIYQIKGE